MLKSLARLCSALLSAMLLIARTFLSQIEAQKLRARTPRPRPVTREPEPTRPEPAIRALQATADTTRTMAEELRRVLDEDENHREVYGHLARFERKFAKYGLRTVEQLPVDQLRRALSDFEALVRNWSSLGLADLRSRMAVVLADRSSAASVWIAANSIVPAGRPGTESMGARLARPLGMSRFELGDGFHSTSAPA